MTDGLPQKIVDQIDKAGLPTSGDYPYEPQLTTNRRGDTVILKRNVSKGPRKGKRGYVDVQGRIWVKDRGHGNLPDHWDVQLNDGDYFRVDFDGRALP